MNKSMLVGIVLGVGVAATGGVIAGYKILGEDQTEAQLAQQACHEETVTHEEQAKDERRIAGTVIGALVGGAVGKDVGDRDITTAAGAAAGALAGNQIQNKIQENNTYTTTETRCDPIAR